MSSDPWSRPTARDVQNVLESIEPVEGGHQREGERLQLKVPAEVTTARGNTIAAMTREISRRGIGLLHRGAITPGTVRVQVAGETRQFVYEVQIEWCRPCENGMFLSGGRFLSAKTESV